MKRIALVTTVIMILAGLPAASVSADHMSVGSDEVIGASPDETVEDPSVTDYDYEVNTMDGCVDGGIDNLSMKWEKRVRQSDAYCGKLISNQNSDDEVTRDEGLAARPAGGTVPEASSQGEAPSEAPQGPTVGIDVPSLTSSEALGQWPSSAPAGRDLALHAPSGDPAPPGPAALADNLRLAHNLWDHDTLDRSQDTGLAAAKDAIASRSSMATSGALAEEGPELSAVLAEQRGTVDTAKTLAGLGTDDSAEISRAYIEHQRDRLDLDPAQPVPLAGHDAPSRPLFDLAERYDADLASDQLRDLERLDELPSPLPGALARLIDAFVALDAAAADAYEDADPRHSPPSTPGEFSQGAIADLSVDPVPLDGFDRGEAGILETVDRGDLATLLETRHRFLEAVLEVRVALAASPLPASDGPTVQAAPAFSINLARSDDIYREDYALMLDAGGADRYDNNAGGNNLAGGEGNPADHPEILGAAALADFGPGDDRMGDPDRTYGGTNGGAYLGSGFLFNEAGDTIYTAGARGTNGGAMDAGTGFLLDLAGDDTYEATLLGTNGGAFEAGLGALVDLDGDDGYEGTHLGTNGGASYYGSGFLLDGSGDDRYDGGNTGTNGGGFLAAGTLLDLGGEDRYEAGGVGTNGGGGGVGSYPGHGFLWDGSGDDAYSAHAWGANGGANTGVGLLVDEDGDDTYHARWAGANGGAARGLGFLIDAHGDDSYEADHWATNGAATVGAGLLLDAQGEDRYEDPQIPGQACEDCSLFPKGSLGLHIDTDDPLGERLPEDNHDRSEHSPIQITEDQGPNGFILGHEPSSGEPIPRPGSGVVAGNGTAENPYVIADWQITLRPHQDSPRRDVPSPPETSGILLHGVDAHVVVANNWVESSDMRNTGIRIVDAPNATIEDNTVVGTRTGIQVSEVRDVHIENNTAAYSAFAGLALNDAPGAIVRNQTSTVAATYGIYADDSPDLSVQGASVRSAVLNGMRFYEAPDPTVEGSHVTLTGSGGIVVRESDGARLENNTLARAGGGGVTFWDSDDGLVEGSAFADNGAGGLRLAGSGHTVVENRFDGDGILVSISADVEIGPSNRVNGDPIVFLDGQEDQEISPPIGQLIVRRSANVTVEDVETTNLSTTAISVAGSQNVTIENATASRAPQGIGVWDADTVRILDSDISENWRYGVLARDADVAINGSTVHDNGVAGINVKGGKAALSGNEILRVTEEVPALGAGIRVKNAEGSLLEDNRVEDYGQYPFRGAGIAVTSDNATLEGNTVVGSLHEGIRIAGVDEASVAGNLVRDNDGPGVLIERSSIDIDVAENRLADNGRGILVDTWVAGNVTATIDANEVVTNGEGIVVAQSPGDIVLRNNNVRDNSQIDGQLRLPAEDEASVGLRAEDVEGQVDARWNWWGCPEGPDHGDCDDVVGEAGYDPWLAEPNPDAGPP